jgi:hypothetical protein
MTVDKGTAVWYCDTEEERDEQCGIFEDNPDFTHIGHFTAIYQIYEELEYQGLTDDEIREMSQNRYGQCLEIIEYQSHYDAYIGTC